jgi:TatD DNase family protein
MLVTGSNLDESQHALDVCKNHASEGLGLFSTVGVHPCHSMDFMNNKQNLNDVEYMTELRKFAIEGKKQGIIRAIGEIGLDCDRLHFAPADVQRKYFRLQLEHLTDLDLPFFLHSRAAHLDFKTILAQGTGGGTKLRGVVHSFTGTLEEVNDYLSMGLYIGINGCSLKTQENLDVVSQIPLDKVFLETDGPWCEIRPSHESFKKFLAKYNGQGDLIPFQAFKKEKFQLGSVVKGRCEPCLILLVARVVAELKGVSIEQVADICWKNTTDLFG